MTETVFTIFEGRDAGKSFAVGDRPTVLGREIGCDIVLRDDRASREHMRIFVDGDRVMARDLNSSNGTFVNGRLVTKCALREGDVIEIGRTKIVLGAAPPSAEAQAGRKTQLAPGRPKRPVTGAPTQVLPPDEDIQLKPVEARLTGILEAVAEASRSLAGPRGIHVGVEMELESDAVTVDTQQLYKALAGLLAGLLEIPDEAVAEAETETRHESMMALRAEQDLERGGIKLDVILIGRPISRARIASREEEGAFLDAHHIVMAHGGALEMAPADSPDVLARVRLPVGAAGAARDTIVR